MNDVPSYLRRAAEKVGCTRVMYDESKMPSVPEDVCVMTFFGDMRSSFILSSILLKRYREEIKGSKYFILCGWPGYAGLFPYVDEYWEIKGQLSPSKLYRDSTGFDGSEFELSYQRRLNRFFEDVVHISELKKYYDDGITQDFWDRFGNVQRTLPSVPSIGIMGQGFIQELMKAEGSKVMIFPVQYIQHWKNGRLTYLRSSIDFWIKLAERMIKEGITPVVYHNFLTHDLSKSLTDECIHIDEPNISKLLGVMRYVGCVLDIGSGISRLAIAARAPFVYCDERSRYVGLKEYEIDGLCCEKTLPRKYIFTFSTIINIEDENLWKLNFFDNIIVKLNNLIKNTDYDNLPSTSESTTIVSYEDVRQRKMMRLGTKFIKVKQD